MSDNTAIHRDTFWLMCGNRIGSGMSRVAYTCEFNSDWVIKVEDRAQSFQNVREWEAWQWVKDHPEARWFAPCLHISPNGSVLIQRRTITPRPKEFMDRMPVFLGDFKRQNYGMLDGKLVCHDYGTNMLMEHGRSQKMRKVEWWDE